MNYEEFKEKLTENLSRTFMREPVTNTISA